MAGETSFAALLAIAAVQGALVMNQYSSNPVGGLIVPPGLTAGCEDANTVDTIDKKKMESSATSGTTSQVISDNELEKMLCDASDSQVSCSLKKWWHQASQALVLFLPLLASGPVGMGLMRCSHLMHMAVIMGLAHLYDFFRKLPAVQSIDPKENEDETLSGDHPRILVLGDSMAVGIGCCEIFDEAKVFDLPLHKEERLEIKSENGDVVEEELPGPVFPLVLARTLSHRLNKPVAWRSAGVDGGDTNEIGEYLLDVVQEEVAKNRAPDVVVVLTGSNDLKQILRGSASVRGFRSSLMKLAHDIRTISPKTKVVFPSLPTFRLDRKSILNIFPLTIFLDGIIGFWDAQKSFVAEKCPGVLHIGLTAAEVNQWYKEEHQGYENVSLISADGIHPNGKCYAKWATLVGNKLVDSLHVKQVPAKAEAALSRPQPVYSGGLPAPAFISSK